MSSSFAKVASRPAPCIWRPSTGRPQSQASGVRHRSGTRPTAGFARSSLNEITQATIDLRAPCPFARFPAPESFPARAVPPQDGLGFNDLGRTEQARPEFGRPYRLSVTRRGFSTQPEGSPQRTSPRPAPGRRKLRVFPACKISTFGDEPHQGVANGRGAPAWRKNRPTISNADSRRRSASSPRRASSGRRFPRSKVIRSSPEDLRPMFEAVLENATRLCEASFGALLLHEDGAYRLSRR